ncbi:hypothetical protein CEUSTIGMA_g7956.t1 [Chlamydomonas eustigma]|uniref:Uncharacterized protein n=1 Tax=Chlamydomonas eustigma TaxID=1157962 RepID=A0A250XBQ7_9CHLO|nr:hypothetical protein CEUSTIGMA_g7956.t1 [Chlamydomonas eustigma]|eukprot:GAX80518.1 hypothetical protein CEUSTIGMA_g7956.t1 [Chlamydomonas eustigma]
MIVGSSAVLWCRVDIDIQMQVPHPLSPAPRPLLSLAATLVTKFTIQQLLPAFLQLLSVDLVDYECTWDYCAITDDPEDPDLLINCTCGGTRPRRKVSLPINPELVVDCKACPVSIITLKKRVKVG